MTIGEKIRARRIELNMTTEELGEKIGVPRLVTVEPYPVIVFKIAI